ncbi:MULTISPECIES: MarR family transcriptional regulator [Rhodobacterales]|uniref:MarR family winged helix-turn-helix transcriptional regulator n=1 Tax=Rhodobacterales TaxID=204455 RepID=UPI003297868C
MTKPLDNMQVSDMFCLAAYAATHVINQRYTPMLRKLGLTYPQYITLLILQERGPASVGDIGAALCMTSSTTTPLLKRLEALGFVTRQRDPNDERKVVVSLTAAGQQAIAQAPAITDCMVAQTKLSGSDLTQMVGLLRSLTSALTDADDTPQLASDVDR